MWLNVYHSMLLLASVLMSFFITVDQCDLHTWTLWKLTEEIRVGMSQINKQMKQQTNNKQSNRFLILTDASPVDCELEAGLTDTLEAADGVLAVLASGWAIVCAQNTFIHVCRGKQEIAQQYLVLCRSLRSESGEQQTPLSTSFTKKTNR